MQVEPSVLDRFMSNSFVHKRKVEEILASRVDTSNLTVVTSARLQ